MRVSEPLKELFKNLIRNVLFVTTSLEKYILLVSLFFFFAFLTMDSNYKILKEVGEN